MKGGLAIRLRLLVLALLTLPASGTFLQWSLCDGSRGSGLIPYGLLAQLDRPTGERDSSRLILTLNRHQAAINCLDTPGVGPHDTEDAWPEAVVELDWYGLGGSGRFIRTARARLDCEDFLDSERPMPLPPNSSRVSLTLLDDLIGDLPALTTIRLRAHIDSPIFAEAPCIAALMTPAISPSLSSGLRYGPLVLFIFVFVVSATRTMVAASQPRQENEVEVEIAGSDSAAIHAPPIVLPSVYDCLHFLQFVFLTGGLTLAYPGFYPAAAGHLNWFSLVPNLTIPIRSFVPGPLPGTDRMASTYPGVRDGLYEVNGTYGGSFGLEVMTQMVGAPMSCDAWLLMVLLIVCIAPVLGGFLWLLESQRPRNVLGLPLTLASNAKKGLLARVGNGVLRLGLSYITMPLVALTTYQLNPSGFLDAGHLTSSIAVLILILGAFTWLAIRLPAASLGALVVDAMQKRREEAEGRPIYDDDNDAYRDHRFVMTVFVLNIIRGVTIGGLQNWGTVQLAVLAVCEVSMLAAVRVFKPYPTLSCGFAATLLRLAILACFTPFAFPPCQLFRAKSIVGFAALILSAAGLLGAFIAPACWHLWCLACRQWTSPRPSSDPPVLGLRQLQRRAVSRPRLADYVDSSTASCPSFDGSARRLRKGEPSLPSRGPSPSQETRFTRPPRTPTPSLPGEPSRYFSHRFDSRTSSPSPLLSSPTQRSPPTSSRMLVDKVPPRTTTKSVDEGSPTAEDSPTSSTYSSGTGSTRPLGPNWDDYSFREADMFYTAPPPPQAAEFERQPIASASSPASPKPSHKWRSPMAVLKPKPPKKTGFSVARPGRPH